MVKSTRSILMVMMSCENECMPKELMSSFCMFQKMRSIVLRLKYTTI